MRGDHMGVLLKNTNITIYNKYYDQITGYDKYQKTLIKGVNWQNKRNATLTLTNGLLVQDSVLIFISKLNGYVSPRDFKLLSDIERPNYFTYGIGDKIVKGEIDFTITGVKPYSLADLEKGYDNVVTIMGVRECSGHWEVEGK